MCGILGIVARSPVNQLLYDGLLLLQHRGQDAAGIRTSARQAFHIPQGTGMGAAAAPCGTRPAVSGYNETDTGTEYMVAWESVAVDALGFRVLRDIAPGEAVFIDEQGNFHTKQCAPGASLNP